MMPEIAHRSGIDLLKLTLPKQRELSGRSHNLAADQLLLTNNYRSITTESPISVPGPEISSGCTSPAFPFRPA